MGLISPPPTIRFQCLNKFKHFLSLLSFFLELIDHFFRFTLILLLTAKDDLIGLDFLMAFFQVIFSSDSLSCLIGHDSCLLIFSHYLSSSLTADSKCYADLITELALSLACPFDVKFIACFRPESSYWNSDCTFLVRHIIFI